ncbi:outer membrane protein OmpK [Pseudobacteriovorax antillogorgiicola]|uniref:Nucleoside-specific outer membrane channel protein Tsx n=1 Tax=Pseudobacteriovorax antillogorgiicola TaxID=1513793 RepID=A0A1Y6C9N6_9BACT|nr:outer membrane protein OmpK [Pseudobacteriovorax antillogorgiicola]TCS51772.1 nucleoside-specific outer membrane channel protein Tsx [Pseudobacteriovorax antillogorgiicola]SMF49871.1 Nucleoside-specific outer membrane channel protein Tsx [Pseudobacteriovorax antillogorgiicola]
MGLLKNLALSSILLSGSAVAADWSNTSISLLSGTDYVNPFGEDYDQTIITFEHVSGWTYGDNFFFVDVEKADTKDDQSMYLEWNPRFSYNKIMGQQSDGLVADFGIAAQINIPVGFRRIYLYGFYVDLKIPGFNFFQSHFYVRDDLSVEGTGFQVTLVWGLNIIDKLSFGGFLDYAGEEGDDTGKKEANLLMQPQLLYQVTKEIALGVEFQYWDPKLAVKDADTEQVPQAMIRWTL